MPAITTPLRVPRRRSSHAAAHPHPHPHGPAAAACEEIAHLGLADVRERLARNERVLASALFSTSPTASTGAAAGEQDPVRDRLLAVRDALRAREAELLATSIGAMTLDTGGGAGAGPAAAGAGSSIPVPSTSGGGATGGEALLATSPPARGGKARAFEAIRAAEAAHPLNGIGLPLDQSLKLGMRDYDNQTAARLEAMTLTDRKPRRPHRARNQLGREANAARYARAHADSDGDADMFDSPEAYAAAGVYAADAHDMGTGLPLATARARRAEGFEDDLRSDPEFEGVGESDSEFLEGNDEYEGNGHDSMDGAPR